MPGCGCWGCGAAAARAATSTGWSAPDRLHEVLAEADFVHVAAPLTDETRHLIDGAAMDAMKPGAGLVNFGRGPVVDVAALAERLRAGRLGGAVLDVHDPEPLPPDSPLWDVPNLILTPHVSSDDDVSYIPEDPGPGVRQPRPAAGRAAASQSREAGARLLTGCDGRPGLC